MKPNFYEAMMKTDGEGNFNMECEYNIAEQLAFEITRHRESLWKHFCKDVCERVLEDMGVDPDIKDFRIVFERNFEGRVKEWMSNETRS